MAVRKTDKGLALKRWFKEKWVDTRTGKPCGRRKGEKRGTPYCRPSKRISSKTPKTASELTASEKRSRIAQNGYDKVIENHTQVQRVDFIIEKFSEWNESQSA